MDKSEFLREQFITLRQEIKAIKARIFWITLLGIFGVPIVTYLAETSTKGLFVSPMIPYLVIVLIVMFLAEQNALMRAGRYVLNEIEPHVGHSPGWETWLGGHSALRVMDKHLFAVFMLVFFAYYFMSIGFAIEQLWSIDRQALVITVWTVAAVVTYAVGGIWAIVTFLHHWRTVTTTTGGDD